MKTTFKWIFVHRNGVSPVIQLRSSFLNSLIHQLLHHLLQHSSSTGTASFEVRSNALLYVLANHVNLHVDIITLPLVAHDDFLLCVSDEHHLPPSFVIVDSRNSERCAIQSHISFLHNVSQHKLVPRLEAECDRIAVLSRLRDFSNRVHMSLYEVAAHARVRPHSSLKVDSAVLLQAAQVRPTESLRRNADLELVFAELCHRKAGAINTDAVAEVCVSQNVGTTRDGQAGAAAAARGFVMLCEAGNSWLSVSAAAG